jgi:hypothetical protein
MYAVQETKVRHDRYFVLVIALAIAFFTLREHGRADIAGEQARASLDVRSSDFSEGGFIPAQCQGTEERERFSNFSPGECFCSIPAPIAGWRGWSALHC